MLTKKERESILSEFPEKMSKEQFYKLCHISKNHARALLTSGTVPCRVNQRATHKYEIATLDVIAYLESLPRVRRKRGGVPQKPKQPRPPLVMVPQDLGYQLRAVCEATLEPFPDVMDPRQISQAIGYADTTIVKWCGEGRIRSFQIRNIYMVPKPWLIDFLLTPHFLNQTVFSLWYQRNIQPVIEVWMNRNDIKESEE